MEARFQNNQVAKIVGLTQRQVIAWTEKGLVAPGIEAKGAGTKREYTYVNLIEFGLAKNLLGMGFGIQVTKKFLSELRSEKVAHLGKSVIAAWSEDFSNFFEYMAERWLDHWKKAKEKNPELTMGEVGERVRDLVESRANYQPEEPTGFLIWFFGMAKEYYLFSLRPFTFEHLLEIHDLKEQIKESTSILIVNIGKIKKEIDGRI